MSAEFFQLLLPHFESLEQKLNQLDAITGDGDHGTTMVKGLRAAASETQTTAAKAFRRAAGGASGSLFSQLVGALEESIQQPTSFSSALQSACDKIFQLGQAVAGDKTMLDALLPAAEAKDVQSAAAAARAGAEDTVNLQAKRGRAKYVEGAGIGHIDPGAVSVAEILAVFAHYSQSVDETQAFDTDKNDQQNSSGAS